MKRSIENPDHLTSDLVQIYGVAHRKASRWRSFAAAAVAVCMVLVSGALYAGKMKLGTSAQNVSPKVTQALGLFSTGFQPIAPSNAAQFQHVDSITVMLGNNWGVQIPDSVDGATIQLTPTLQQMFYHIMQANQTKSVTSQVQQTTSFPLSILFSTSNGKDQFTYGGYYSTSGAMMLGSKMYAANSALAQFMIRYVLNQLLQKYRDAGKALPHNLSQAALEFVRNLEDVSIAYKYCVPDMVFSNNTGLRQLQSQASSRGFTDFQIESITYGPGNADATVVLKNPNRFWETPVTLNLVHLGQAWIVTQAALGTEKTVQIGSTTSRTKQSLVPGNPYDGRTPLAPFGKYHTLIIGPSVGMVLPTGNTPYLQKGQYRALTYNELNSPEYQSAQIIVFERMPLTKDSTVYDASQALVKNSAFQKAVSAAKSRHAVLVVAGGADNLLTRDMLEKTLGVQSTTGSDSNPATTISVWFEGTNKAMFSGVSAVENGGKRITSFNPSLLDMSISQAALIRDTWGAVIG